MAKASPIQPAYIGGELSPLVRGRVDNERWDASLEQCENGIPLIQGPIMKRPGSKYIANAHDDTVSSRLIDFRFSTEQSYVLEFGDSIVRVYKDQALVLDGAAADITGATAANPVVITTSGSHGFNDGDHVYIASVGGMTSVNNRVFEVANKTSTTFELSGVDGSSYPAYTSGGTVAKVYEFASPYGSADLDGLTWIQSADTLYIFHEDYQPRTLTRTGHTSWTFDTYDMEDGPYLEENDTATTLTPADYGGVVPKMTSNTAPSGTVSSSNSSSTAWKVFDKDKTTDDIVSSGTSGWVKYDIAGSGTATADAYWITGSLNSSSQPDNIPRSWTFDGYDGSSWVTLDEQDGISFDDVMTKFFSFHNATAFEQYRLNWHTNNGAGNSEFAELGIHQKAEEQTAFNLTASSVTGINDDTGFQTTDVGRHIRFMASDGRWRWAKIIARTSTTVVTIQLYGHALPNLQPTNRWRLGRYSDTTSWPTHGFFHEDRLVVAGPSSEVYASQNGDYTNHAPTLDDGTTTAATAIAIPNLLSREVNAIRWLAADERSLLVGTTGGEWVITRADNSQAFSSSNLKRNPATFIGSHGIRPVMVGNVILFLSADQRSIHEFAYVFEADGYRAPNMSWMAEHVTASSGIAGMALARSPQSIIWANRADGRLVGFTYDRDQQALAWHQHPLADGSLLVERVVTIPASDNTSEVYALLKKGNQRWICVMDDLWTTSSTKSDAYFVDGGIYDDNGSNTTTLDGLWHLEGEDVVGTVDGEKFTATVSNGAVTHASGQIRSCGLAYTLKAKTMPSNAGATDGTAQGKTKRIHQVVFRVLNSRGGKYGRDSTTTYSLPYTNQKNLTVTSDLGTGDIRVNWPAAYDYDGVVYVEHDDPYPFTLIAHMPQIVTQDRG